MLDLAIAYRIYPGVSKVPAVFPDDKLRLSAICLQSFKRALGSLKFKMWVLLDGCPPIYEQLFRSCFSDGQLEILKLDKLGNLPTFSLQIDILTKQDVADYVYFAEDDYFYLPDALVRMLNFAKHYSDADFITPYDHPGNYDSENGRESHLIRPFHDHHWRTASASCLTFLTRKDVLLATKDIFESYRRKNDDGSLWLSLTQKLRLLNLPVHWNSQERRKLWLKALFWGYKQILFRDRRRLWHAIPSLSTHIESPCLAPTIDWTAEFERWREQALELVASLEKDNEIA